MAALALAAASLIAGQQLNIVTAAPPKIVLTDKGIVLTSNMGPLRHEGPLFVGRIGHTIVDYRIGNSRTLRMLCKIDPARPEVASCESSKLLKAVRRHKPVQIRYRARVESPYVEIAE